MGTPTWKNQYELPYESRWSKAHKVGFVEGQKIRNPTEGENIKTSLEVSVSIGGRMMKYCPQCAKHGYHSVFQQVDFYDHCFLHPEEKLLEIKGCWNSLYETSFYEDHGARVVDVMDNGAFRKEIEDKFSPSFDEVQVIDLLDPNSITRRYCCPLLYESTRKTLRECLGNRPFSAARKVATIAPDADVAIRQRWLDKYLIEEVIPEIYQRRFVDEEELGCSMFMKEDSTEELQYLHKKWDENMYYNDRELLYLIMYKEYTNIRDQVGGRANFKSIVNDLSKVHYFNEFDFSQYDYNAYVKVKLLSLASHYGSMQKFERFFLGKPWGCGHIPLDNALHLVSDGILGHMTKNDFSTNHRLFLPIFAEILSDLLSHTATVIGNLMKEGKFIIGGPGKWIQSTLLFLPTSQYVTVWKSGTIELWACDPKVEGLISNLTAMEENWKATRVLKELPSIAAV